MLRRGAPLVLALFAMSCSSKSDDAPAPQPPAPVVDLRADVNRNGTVDLADPTEDQDETTWDAKHGAIFLANIDDDLHACPTKGADGKPLGDADLPLCNDAANEQVDGDDDALDLAPMKTAPWADAPADAIGTLAVNDAAASFVRIFQKTDAGWVVLHPGDAIAQADIVRGLELGIEAKDIVRDPAVWEGVVDVTWHVTAKGVDQSDTVRLKVAPVLLQHHGTAAERVVAAKVGDQGSADFRRDLGAAVTAALPGVTLEQLIVPEDDVWVQDFMEVGYTSMPAPGGTQHVMRIVLRSANRSEGIAGGSSAKELLRAAGRLVFTYFRGKDVAGVQQFDPKSDLNMDSLNSFGNTETIPPYENGSEKWPLGRIIRGSVPSFHPDATMEKLLESQGQQKPLLIDTSWLFVGHVDETLSFLPMPDSKTSRTFMLLASDARLAKKMLDDQVAAGHGDTMMFVGMKWVDDMGTETPADKSISQVLADADRMAASQKAAADVDGQLTTVKDATGLTDDEVVPVPFLYEDAGGGLIAYQPGTVNGIWLDPKHYASPRPHGPVVDGKDIFEAQLETALAAKGVTVTWVEDWNDYHRMEGEVHCGSNVFRKVPDVKWWEVAK